jgi:hypothetical protein
MSAAGHGHDRSMAHARGAERWRARRRGTDDRGGARSAKREPASDGQSTRQGGGGGGETHQGGVAPVGRWVRVAMAALDAAMELRWTASTSDSPWSTKVTGKR